MGFFSSLFGGKKELTPEKLEQQRQKNFEILKFDGMKAQKMGQMPYSVKCFSEALALKEDFNTRLYLTNSYMALQEYALAMEQLENLAEQDPQNLDTFLMMARVADHLQNWQIMNDACQKAYLLDENNAEVYYYFGKACYGLEDEISAVAMLTKALTFDENNKQAYLLRSQVLENMQQLVGAEADIDKLLQLEPEDESYLLKKGQLRIKSGAPEEAEQYYQKIIDINPFNEPVFVEYAQLLISEKKLDQAMTLLNEAIENKPDFADAYKERGNVKMLQGDKEGALEDLKKSLELAPEEGAKINGEFTNIEEEMNARMRALNPFLQ